MEGQTKGVCSQAWAGPQGLEASSPEDASKTTEVTTLGTACPHVKPSYGQKRLTSPQIQAWVTATATVCLLAEALQSVFFSFGCAGPCCCLRVFSGCGVRASPCGGFPRLSTGPRVRGLRFAVNGLSCPKACGVFPEQGSNPDPLLWRRVLNGWTTGEPCTEHLVGTVALSPDGGPRTQESPSLFDMSRH